MLDGLTVAHWIGGSGNGWDPAHWDIGVVPHDSGGTQYQAIIDLPGSDVTVTIDRNTTVTEVSNTETIRVVGDGRWNLGAGTLVNNGVIDVASYSWNNNAGLHLMGEVLLAGSGQVAMTADRGHIHGEAGAKLTIGPQSRRFSAGATCGCRWRTWGRCGGLCRTRGTCGSAAR